MCDARLPRAEGKKQPQCMSVTNELVQRKHRSVDCGDTLHLSVPQSSASAVPNTVQLWAGVSK
jgi:hypothetical protein